MKIIIRSMRTLCLTAVTAALAGCVPPPLPPPAPPVAPFGLVPTAARRVAVGVSPISYAAAATGPVYVIDETAMSLVTTVSPPSNMAEIIYVDPTLKAVTLQNTNGVEGKTTLAAPIDPTHKFSIWALPSSPTTQP